MPIHHIISLMQKELKGQVILVSKLGLLVKFIVFSITALLYCSNFLEYPNRHDADHTLVFFCFKQ
jgi:hypothetical protein